MGARLKQNPTRTFNWFFEASCPIAKDKDPGLLFQFPEDYSDEESVRNLPRFCFPYDIERVKPGVTVQHFTFVLTDLEGCQRFGFCRQTSGSRTCLCILSYLPWFEVFYKLLNNLADYVTKGQTNEMRELLSALHKHPVPQVDSFVTLQLGEQLYLTAGVQNPTNNCYCAPVGQGKSGIPFFIAPDPRSLPSIPESRNLTELVVAVDVSNLLQLYASMLFERRILIFSSKLSTLTACVHACSAVLFPMYWQHIFIPVLPPHLLDYCCAPMPYLIGVHSSLSERVRSYALEDVVILNVDTNTIESPFDDLKRIPSYVVSALKVRLKKQSAATGTGVAKAFLRAQAELFGGYKEALVCSAEGGAISFCEESFLNHKSKSMRQFLESAVHLQFFKQFIDARLELLNHGKEPADLFEEEILQAGASTSGSKPYQHWMGNLKVGGGALIHTVKSKANVYKTAKSRLRNITSPKEESESNAAMLSRVGSLGPTGSYQHRRVQSDCLQSRLPITQHFGKSRPRRPTRRYTGPLVDESQLEQGSTWTCTWEASLENGATECQQGGADALLEDLNTELMEDPEEMDLLGEIFDTLSTRSFHDRGLIYSTRSLDLFGSDSTDYIIQKKLAAPSEESLNHSTGRSESLLSWGQDGDVEEEQDGATEEEQELSDRLGHLKEEHELRQLKEEQELSDRLGQLKEEQELSDRLGQLKEEQELSDRLGQLKEEQELSDRLGQLKEEQELSDRLGQLMEEQELSDRLGHLKEEQELSDRLGQLKEEQELKDRLGQLKEEQELKDRLGQLKEELELSKETEAGLGESPKQRKQKDQECDSSDRQIECDRRSNQDEDVRREEVKVELRSQEQETAPGSTPASTYTGIAWGTGTSTNGHELHTEAGESVESPSPAEPWKASPQPLSGLTAKTSDVAARTQEGECVPAASKKAEPCLMSPTHRVQEKVTRFHIKAMNNQAGVWKSPSEVSNSRMESRVLPVAVNTGVQQAGQPMETETPGETTNVPPIKVSELKKRFEA